MMQARCGSRIAALAAMLVCNAANASGKIYYGSRAGMQVTVVSMEGLDTSHAVIRTKHTREDAVAFCREYVLNVTQKCIQEELEVPLNDSIEANCRTGVFTDFSGDRHHYLGPNKHPSKDDIAPPKYLIKDLTTGEIEDGSSASGYGVNMGIFKALCPREAPFDPDLE